EPREITPPLLAQHVDHVRDGVGLFFGEEVLRLGLRRCSYFWRRFSGLEYQLAGVVAFAHGQPPYWHACMLGHELVVLGAQRADFVPSDAHGRRPCTIFVNSSKTSACAAAQRARSNSVAATLSCSQ